jgi:hypothetical protein
MASACPRGEQHFTKCHELARRYLHRYPELSFQENITSAYVSWASRLVPPQRPARPFHRLAPALLSCVHPHMAHLSVPTTSRSTPDASAVHVQAATRCLGAPGAGYAGVLDGIEMNRRHVRRCSCRQRVLQGLQPQHGAPAACSSPACDLTGLIVRSTADAPTGIC